MESLKGRVIAITGAASGMGLSIAHLLASRGALLSLADINEGALKDAVDAIAKSGGGEQHIYTKVDVRDSGSVNSWIEQVLKTFGRLDGAVNFAGVGTRAAIAEETDEGFAFVMDVNAKGVFNCLRAELRAMKDRGGSIVSAASVHGQRGFPLMGVYSASKHAVIGLSRSAARENPSVRINCVAPGVMATPMTDDDPEDSPEVARQVQKRQADPIEVGAVVAFLLGDEAKFVTGAVWDVDGGFLC